MCTYCSLRGKIQEAIKILRASKRETPQVTSSSSLASVSAKLPQIDLPKFGGKLTEWIPFFQAFNALVHVNRNLSDIDKFLYLKSLLSGSAAQIINSSDISAENYENALDSLKPTFNAFHEFLIRRSQTLENFDTRSISKQNSNSNFKPKKEKVLSVNGSSNLSCSLCNETNHTSLSFSPKFKALETPTRFNEVKSRNLCTNCLGSYKRTVNPNINAKSVVKPIILCFIALVNLQLHHLRNLKLKILQISSVDLQHLDISQPLVFQTLQH